MSISGNIRCLLKYRLKQTVLFVLSVNHAHLFIYLHKRLKKLKRSFVDIENQYVLMVYVNNLHKLFILFPIVLCITHSIIARIIAYIYAQFALTQKNHIPFPRNTYDVSSALH